MKSVVVETPKGVLTRLMPGCQALEHLDALKKGQWGSKSNPGPAANYQPHMDELHRKFLKEMGLTNEQYIEKMENWKR